MDVGFSRFEGLGFGVGIKIRGVRSRVRAGLWIYGFRGLGLRVVGLGFRVGFKVRGVRFRVRAGLWI